MSPDTAVFLWGVVCGAFGTILVGGVTLISVALATRLEQSDSFYGDQHDGRP